MYCDVDFAGCERTRTSTSGGVQLGSQRITSWSKSQSVIALSIREAELAVVVRASSGGLGLRSLLGDLGVKVHLCDDSDATVAIDGATPGLRQSPSLSSC